MQLILAFAEEKRKVKKGLGDIIYRIIFFCLKPENSEIKSPSGFYRGKEWPLSAMSVWGWAMTELYSHKSAQGLTINTIGFH